MLVRCKSIIFTSWLECIRLLLLRGKLVLFEFARITVRSSFYVTIFIFLFRLIILFRRFNRLSGIPINISFEIGLKFFYRITLYILFRTRIDIQSWVYLTISFLVANIFRILWGDYINDWKRRNILIFREFHSLYRHIICTPLVFEVKFTRIFRMASATPLIQSHFLLVIFIYSLDMRLTPSWLLSFLTIRTGFQFLRVRWRWVKIMGRYREIHSLRVKLIWSTFLMLWRIWTCNIDECVFILYRLC